jgi:hypothetical protein
MLAARFTTPTEDINGLLAGSALSAERMNAQLAQRADEHAAEMGALRLAELAAQTAERRASMEAIATYKALAQREALEQAPALAAALLAELQENTSDGCPAVYFCVGDMMRDPYGVRRSDYVQTPECPYEHVLKKIRGQHAFTLGQHLERYRLRLFTAAVGEVFHGTDAALGLYRFMVGHGGYHWKVRPPWPQEEIQLVYKPDEYANEPRLLAGYWFDDHPLNDGYLVDAREVRRW